MSDVIIKGDSAGFLRGDIDQLRQAIAQFAKEYPESSTAARGALAGLDTAFYALLGVYMARGKQQEALMNAKSEARWAEHKAQQERDAKWIRMNV